jgi:hypothetical protein
LEIPKLIVGEELTTDDKVYRYINLKQFLYYIENNKTYLTRISSWDDTWEAPSRKIPTQQYNGKLEFPLYCASMDLFGQCWTLKTESDAMWRIYSPLKDGIKIGTSIKKFELIEGLKHSVIHKVLYYGNLKEGLERAKNISGFGQMFADGLIKRDAFEHEKEVRLITRNDERMIGKYIAEGDFLEYELEYKDFIEEIVIDPRADDYFVDTIKSYCKRAGLKIIPYKSDLYYDNIFEKTSLVQVWRPVK